MTALLIEGFDHYTSAAELTQGGFTSAGTPTFTAGRYGRGQRVTLPTATEDLTYAVTATTEFYFGASIFITQINQVLDTLVSFNDTTGVGTQIQIDVDPSGRLQVTSGSTVLGLATGLNAVLYPGSHYYVEFHGLINNTTGTWDLIVNGTSVTSGSGADTQQTANATINELELHGGANLLPSFDDLYLNDNVGSAPYNGNVGDHELLLRLPNGDGFVNDWTGVGAGATNSDRVNDTVGNDGDTTYVNPEFVADIDAYTYEDIVTIYSGGADTIHSVQYKTAARGDSGSYLVFVRSTATDQDSPTITYNATYEYSRFQSLVDPFTSLAWTSANWDAAEAGVELVST